MRSRSSATMGIVVLVSVILAPAVAAVDTDIVVSTNAIDFGDVTVGDTRQVPVTLTNTGGDSFTPNMFGGAPPTQEFNASQNCQGVQLPPGGSCQITYSFSPGAPGTYSDMSNFTISETDSQGDGEDFSVSLTGRGGVGEVRHARSLTMGLRGDLVAKGRVSAADDFAGCEAGVTVKIQRQRQGRWRTIDTSVTDAEGLYREAIPDRSGSYRAVVGMSAMNAGQDICRRAVSPVSTN